MRAPTTVPDVRGRSVLRDNVHWMVSGTMLAFAALFVVGLLDRVIYPMITLGAVASGLVGIRLRQPSVRWPWMMFSSAAVLWTVAGVVDGFVAASGDLTSDRSLLPDLFAVPGYAMIGVALVGLARTRRADRDQASLIDGVMLAAGVALLVHEWIVEPAMEIDDAAPIAIAAVLVYPIMSLGLLLLAGRLAFAPGGRSVAFSLLLAGAFALHIGDLVFALGQIGRLDPGNALLEVPYLMAPTFFSAAVLHPTARGITRAHVLSKNELGRARALAVTAALAMPPLLLAARARDATDAIAVVICTVLVATAVLRTVTAMRQHAAAADQLYHRATHDDLTGLPGRALLFQQIDDLCDAAHTQHLTLMFIDLDRFKQINDTMGHAAGDELLVLAANRVVSTVRGTDVVYRLAGDEFVVLAPDVADPDADGLASRIREAMRSPFVLSVGQVFSSASIGVATATTGDRARLHALLGEADEAMYSSKQAGRDATTRFDVSMRLRTERRLQLERLLHEALDADALTVAYQPIVTGPSWSICGFEALVRWTVDGMPIHPDEFIPVAEESGLIVPLGDFVLDAACAQLAVWRRNLAGAESFAMSVNLSPRQIGSGDIVEVVADALDRHDLPGDAIWLEITENVMAEDSVTTAAVFAALRQLGVRLSVDDFGTGYSSLSYLKQFPVSRVKIDRSFVTGICHDESDRSLVSAVIAMAGALGLEPVAEGVERPEQAQMLRELGCETMQGYLFGRPLMPAGIDELLADHRPRPD